jgi:xanthine dehydrogenase accessory factor
MQELLYELERGETVAVASIVRRRGSVPREVGAKMLVHRGGRISGTVGGGCGEAEVWRSALNAIDTQRPASVQVELTEEIAMESQGVCGGIFDVFIQPWYRDAPGQPAMCTSARTIHEALMGERAIALLTVVASRQANVGQQMLVHEDGQTLGTLDLPSASMRHLVEVGRQAMATGTPRLETLHGTQDARAEIFVEPFLPPPVLLIAGAGHIAAPLASIAHTMNYAVSVTDDRASFANHERFPHAQRLLVGNIEKTLRDYPITPRTHIVLVTRAHAYDVQGLRAIIDSAAAYIGMIGSQRRVWAVFKLLHAQGVAIEKLMRVRAPIGLDLGGGTPAEIALSIMAEITLLQRGGTGAPMSEALRERFRERLQRQEQE